MKIICGNCQKIMHSEAELAHTFPDIPDLLDRISPGEPVPIGECPECGALVHAVDDQRSLRCSVCSEPVEETKLREHLASHHPGAEELSWKEVRDQFRLHGAAPDRPGGGRTVIPTKVEWILETVNSADVVVVADSPYLHGVETETPTGDPDNEVLWINWHDAEGLEYEVKFTEEGLVHARLEGHTILARDHEGEDTKIELFRLAPMEVKPFASAHSPDSEET